MSHAPQTLLTLSLGLLLSGCAEDPEPSPTDDSSACLAEVPDALRTCLGSVGEATVACYDATDAACQAEDPSVSAALDALDEQVQAVCADEDFNLLTTQALSERLQVSCQSEADSLAWRTYGGPQGAVWPMASSTAKECLSAANQSARLLMDASLERIHTCLTSSDCDAGAVAEERAALASTAQAEIEAACEDLGSLAAVSPETYVERAVQQVDCIAATAHPDVGDLDLACGPGHAQFDAPRGEWTQVVVDGDEWGTLCGDGTEYAFYINPAPEGAALDRVLIGLQGGGVCVFEEDCTAKLESNPGLFNALDDEVYSMGIVSDDPAVSPFSDWTRVYLPYCTQDVFAGGGVIEPLGDLQLPRYGAVNARAAIQMVRDVVWKEMDETSPEGFRPDNVVSVFGGWSAGSYGTLYNYHWMLDDLQWPRTVGYPDAGLALDNGELLGVLGLGLVKIPAWGTLENLPPYCFTGDCAVGPTLLEALSPRLKQVPEQQLMMLTNPHDLIQMYDAYFTNEDHWINTVRSDYCSTRDLPGVSYYFTSVSSESIHVVTLRDELWLGEVDGEVMRDWLWRAVSEPDTVQDRVEEANFVKDIPGVKPFPCKVAP
jgi:hypothetical protein